MAYTNTVLDRARARLRQENERKRAEYEEHLAQAYRLRPCLKEIDRALRGTAAQLAMLVFRREGDPQEELARLRAENEASAARSRSGSWPPCCPRERNALRIFLWSSIRTVFIRNTAPLPGR